MQAVMHTDGIGLEINMLTCMFEAAAGGHELGRWVKVRDGYEAKCQKCGLATYASNGSLYSFLEDVCVGALAESAQVEAIDWTGTTLRKPGLIGHAYIHVESFLYRLMYLPGSLFKLTR
jgi:hypothetical protein